MSLESTQPAAAAPERAPRRGTRLICASWSRVADTVRRMSPRRRWAALSGLLLALLIVWSGVRAWQAWTAYHAALRHTQTIEGYSTLNLASLNAAELDDMQGDFARLHSDLRQLQRATSLPVGGTLVERLPWLGTRYRNGRALLQAGVLLSDAGVSGARVGHDTLTAYAATGVNADANSAAPTWLDTLLANAPELRRVADEVATAKALRAGVDERALPARVRAKLPELDRALASADLTTLVRDDLPVLRAALGGDDTTRYLVLFQNPAELRPSGGFPGTMALVTLQHGQLHDYQVFDAHTLSDDYIAANLTHYPQPWPIQQFFPSPALVLHDASWWADFPRAGATLMDMYNQTDWPHVDGVIAVQPTVISDLLRVTGNVTIDVDGEQRLITPDNVYDEIERQRLLHREGLKDTEDHKEALALIGEQIMERLKSVDQSGLKTLADALRGEADRRDVQLYSANAGVESWLDGQRWSGRLTPDPATPTLDIVLANVNTNKASERLDAYETLSIGAPTDGRRQVTVQLYLRNTGTNAEDPFYAGYQKWWIEVTLPQGAGLIVAQPAAEPDPEAPSGGSYLVPVFPQQVGYLTFTFTMPDASTLLLRRQPGAVPLQIHLEQVGCAASDVRLTQDTTLQLGACATAP